MGSKAIWRAIRSRLHHVQRCHPMTWMAMVLVAGVTILLMVSGSFRHAPHGDQPGWWDQQCHEVYIESRDLIVGKQILLYEHGWPRPWLVRSREGASHGGIFMYPAARRAKGHLQFTWRHYDNWPLEGVRWRIHPGNMLLNGATAILLIGGTGWLTERWVRSRGGLFRFRLIDLLSIATLVAVIFGWRAYHRQVARSEAEVVKKIESDLPRSQRGLRVSRKYVGPEWLRILAGDDIDLFQHVYQIDIPDDIVETSDLELVARLPYLERIRLSCSISHSDLESLRECYRLESIQFTVPGHDRASALLVKSHEVGKEIGINNLDKLSVLDLKEIQLFGPLVIREDLVRALEGNKKLERLEVTDTTITPEEVADLRSRYSGTSITVNRFLGRREPDVTPETVAEIQRLRRDLLGPGLPTP